MADDDFTPDDIAIAVEIPGLYDGTAAYLLHDGTWRNRFAGSSNWGDLPNRIDEWIASQGDAFRAANLDRCTRIHRVDNSLGEAPSARPTGAVTEADADEFARMLGLGDADA